MERFDDQFNKQVKRAFGNYNADHLADAGWNALQQKRAKSPRLSFVIPFWAKAAAVTILLTIGGIFTYRLTKNINQQIADVVEQVEIKKEAVPEAFVKTDAADSLPTSDRIALSTSDPIKREIKYQLLPEAKPSEPIIEAEIADTSKSIYLAQSDDEISSDSTRNEVILIALVEENDSIPIEEVTPVEEQKIATLTDKEIEEEIIKLNLLGVEEPSSTPSKTSLGAGISGMMASIEDMVSSSPGIAVGVYSQHRLTDKISIRPGLAIARHSYAIESLSGSDKVFANIGLDELAGGMVEFENHMDIVAMEVPINFVFSLSERENRNLFVSAGMSSIVYLNQHYTETYTGYTESDFFNVTSGEWEVVTQYRQVDIDNHYGSFSHTDLFGLVNVSAGYSFPFGKNTFMLVEPFIQIPTRKLTSSEIKIGFWGLSLKVQVHR
ncbi:MAG TPA: hypothetical protein DDY04_03755 [Bacteroidales bacterium]|nr:hypothetical protein [Bacteroidales bacterium]